jgi:hypothetical protein
LYYRGKKKREKELQEEIELESPNKPQPPAGPQA